MEKNLSLTFDETSALLEMSVCSYADADDEVATAAILKLRELFREFAAEDRRTLKHIHTPKLRRAA